MNRPAHIAVVGAGVLGAALAHRLVRHAASPGTTESPAPGVSAPAVTLLDRAEPGHGTSRWSLAWLNSNGVPDRGYHDLRTASLDAWARLAEEAGGAEWYRPVGNMRWADPTPADPDDPAEGGKLTERVQRLRRWGYAAELVPAERIPALEPALRLPPEVREVAWYPEEGYVRTERCVAALLAGLRKAGGDLRTGSAGHVIALERADIPGAPGEGPGSRPGGWLLRTADGSTLRADAVVCCAGRWTPEVTGLAGTPVPLVEPTAPGSPAPGLVVRAGPVATPLTRIVHTPHVHLRPHGEDGGATVHLEAGDVHVGLHTPAEELDRWAETLLTRARALVPGLAGARVLERQVCVRPLPLDGRPVVGRVPGTGDGAGQGAESADEDGSRTDGPYVVVTHSGVTLAAGLAEMVAAELLTGRPEPALEPYRPTRLRRD
ncbi:FAD-binding oxidoreductase [Streptomyces albus]|uniref:NAD(P)/FAD-dependent oxidoreductase n=1 Tax=Streptomyces albus TaxID=1888 RepID=UPI0024ACA4B7|nr:FAD-binding oxidoreductase [Streptomyces albus]MDI6410096.1 FAD-binding oxidoreductase [Streptomyces albus]